MKDLVWEGRDYGIIGNSLKRRNCCQEDGCRVPQEQDYLCYCKYGMDLNGQDSLIVERGSFYSWRYIYHGFPSLVYLHVVGDKNSFVSQKTFGMTTDHLFSLCFLTLIGP